MTYKDVKIKKTENKNVFGKVLIFLIVLVVLLGGGIVIAAKKGVFDPISIVSTISAAELEEADGRTNILMLGSDKRSNSLLEYGTLTDTLLFISIGRVEHDVVMISLPRDLWVEDPRGAKSKINAVYVNNEMDDSDDISGGDAIMSVVEDVLGLPVHYYSVVNFEIFKDAVNILGGIDVDVERDFIDYYYPIEGKENAPRAERYETVEFKAGKQNMDGETALKYARSRKGTNDEGTDFARSERQQRVIAAIKDKVLSLETILNPSKIKDLFELYKNEVDTNIAFEDVQNFYILSQQIAFDRITSVVLDDRSVADEGGLLYSPVDNELYGGAYVLIPRSGDFSQIHAYAQRYLFSAKN